MLTITDFLLARIAEDEGRARNAQAGYAMHWPECDYPGDMPGVCICDLRERVLAECESKRRIVDAHRNQVENDDPHAWIVGSRELLKALAAVYADHEDYRADWA